MKRRNGGDEKVEQESKLKKLLEWQAAELTKKLDEIQTILARTDAEAKVIVRAAKEGT